MRKFTLVLLLFLSACGGGGGGISTTTPPPPPPTFSIEGIWEGTAQGENVYVIIDGQGNMYSVGVTPDCVGINVGHLAPVTMQALGGTSSGSGYYSPDLIGNVNNSGCAPSQASLFSTVLNSSGSMAFTSAGQVSGGSFTVNVTLASVTNSGASLATIAGNYTEPDGTTLSINGNGTLFLQDANTGCVVNGQVTISDASVDIYNFSATYSSCQGTMAPLNGLTLTGEGWYNATGVNGGPAIAAFYTLQDGNTVLFGFEIDPKQ